MDELKCLDFLEYEWELMRRFVWVTLPYGAILLFRYLLKFVFIQCPYAKTWERGKLPNPPQKKQPQPKLGPHCNRSSYAVYLAASSVSMR